MIYKNHKCLAKLFLLAISYRLNLNHQLTMIPGLSIAMNDLAQPWMNSRHTPNAVKAQ